MNSFHRNIPAVPVESSDLNQGSIASYGINPRGRCDVPQDSDCPKSKTSNGKFSQKITKLQMATYDVRTFSDDIQLANLEEESENINWDIIGISKIRRPNSILELANGNVL